MAVSAAVRTRAVKIAEAWANGTHVQSDEPDLRKVIVNTLSRSIAFTPKGKAELDKYAEKLARKYGRGGA